MQLQNKETKVKYSIALDQDEMNDLIRMLEKAFRGSENEPTTTL